MVSENILLVKITYKIYFNTINPTVLAVLLHVPLQTRNILKIFGVGVPKIKKNSADPLLPSPTSSGARHRNR